MSAEFKVLYAKLSDLSYAAVVQLMIDTDKTDTKYSRLRTCKALWDERQAEINVLEAQIDKEMNRNAEAYRKLLVENDALKKQVEELENWKFEVLEAMPKLKDKK